jgi:hypothetical protein
MSPLTHLLASWVVATATTDNPRDRRLVTLAGVLPDLDGLGIIVDLAHDALGHKATHYYANYHHVLLHGIFGAGVLMVALTIFAQRRWRVALLTLAVFHLHLLCDFIGSRGPSPEDLWPIFYLAPFTKEWMWIWRGQWQLDGWQNRTVFVCLFAWSLWYAVRYGHSFVAVLNRRADRVFVEVLRKWARNLTGGTPTAHLR